MGNYRNLESEFIERTLSLIEQYEDILEQYPFEEQFNYTLAINCLLGLIVMPKEKVITYVPTIRITKDLLCGIGAPSLKLRVNITNLRELIQALRHSVAHFDISVISENDKHLVDWLEFSDSVDDGSFVAKFRAEELLPFLRYYAKCLLENMRRNRQ